MGAHHCMHFINYILLFLLCLPTFSTTPIALIKTSKLVDPALMNGSGNPVGGIEPVNISYCIVIFTLKKSKIYCSFFETIKYLCHLR